MVAVSAYGAPLQLSHRAVDLNPEDETVRSVGVLDFRGGIELRSTDRRFGGLSGLSVSADGSLLSAVGDKGIWVTARLIYDARGRLAGAANGRIGPLLSPGGTPVAGTRFSDAESMARIGRSFAVAFEGDHRIWLYPASRNPFARRPRPFVVLPTMKRSPSNGGIEAMVVLKDGRLIAIAEQLRVGKKAVLGWIIENRTWRHLIYERSGRFVPTGAASLPDGGALVLERRFSWIGGVASRIVRFAATDFRPGARLRGREVAVIDPPLTIENFEGIAARANCDGTVLVYLVSDDNFNVLQRTLLLMFALRK